MNLILAIATLCLLFFAAGAYGLKKMRGRRRKKFLCFSALLFLCAAAFLLAAGDERKILGNRFSKYGNEFFSEYLPDAAPLAKKAFEELEKSAPDPNVNGGAAQDNAALPAEQREQELQVDFLNVGQGLSVLVRSGGHSLLYDGGGRESSSFLVAYLKDQGIQKIDFVVASHYDSDHISGLNGVLNVFDAGRILGPDYEGDTAVYRSFVRYAGEQNKEIEHPSAGDVFQVGSASVKVLAPREADPDDDNNSSLVLLIQNGQNSFLLMGDAEGKEEKELLNSGVDFSCDVLCVGHHGSFSSTTDPFLEKAAPSGAVISCGKNNSYGHPHADTLKRLQNARVSLFRTDLQGTVSAFSDGASIRFSTAAWEEN